MPNLNAPSGLRPVRHINGSPYNGQYRRYAKNASDATNLFVGDIVKLAAGSDADGNKYVTAITTVATDVPVGVVVGFAPNPDNLMQRYSVASTARVVFVCDDPEVISEVQLTGTYASGNVGQNASPNIATAGNTTTGVSGHQLDSATIATTNTLMLGILGPVLAPTNDLTSANARVEVRFNKHQYTAASTGV